MKVVCLGDSNTWGFDPRGPFGGRYPSHFRWVDILASNTGWNVQNEGENGRCIPIRTLSLPEDPDLLTVMLGTNDILEGRDADAAAKRMETFLSTLPCRKENILLIVPVPLRAGAWVSADTLIGESEKLCERYRCIAQRLGVRFADAGTWNIPLAYDGVHFTEEGHKRFAQELLNFLV